MPEYTPTTEQVRAGYEPLHATGPNTYDLMSEEEAGAEFDRWLAAHDAQVLRAAALSGDFGTTAQSALLRRAERISGARP